MQNPFYGYGITRIGEQVVGREHEIERITNYLISHSGSINIIGDHQIGKSSLISEVMNRVNKIKNDFYHASLDVSTLHDDSIRAFQEMLDNLIENIREKGKELPKQINQLLAEEVSDSYGAYRRCRRGLTILQKAGMNSLIILDQFDAVCHFKEATSFIQRLRELTDSRHVTGLSLVIISRRSIIAIEKQHASVSNLDGTCEKHYVTPLNDDGLNAIVKRCGDAWKLSEEEHEMLKYYSGGHPYLAEMILCHSWEQRSVESGVEKCQAHIFDHYQHLRNLLMEDDLFKQLLQVTVGPRWNLKNEAVARLVQYGFIKKIVDSDGTQFRGWSEHFHAYLEKCSREVPQWEIWKQTEGSLRDLIESVCEQQLGSNWINILCKRHKSVGEIIEGCKDRMLKEQKNFTVNASDSILEYTYPMDLWKIISAEWQTFRVRFGNKNTKYWGERFDLLSKVRTPTAHNREHVIPEHELTLAQGYCQEILSVINNSTEITD